MLLSLFLPRSAVLVAGCQIPSSLQESRTSLECVKRGEVMGRLVLWTPGVAQVTHRDYWRVKVYFNSLAGAKE